MRCTVLLFAQLADELGFRRVELDVPEGTTVDEAMTIMGRQYELLEGHRRTLAYAINESYVRRDALLREGDTLALIPPVSGG